MQISFGHDINTFQIKEFLARVANSYNFDRFTGPAKENRKKVPPLVEKEKELFEALKTKNVIKKKTSTKDH